MKNLKNIMAGVCLTGVSCLAQANFSYTLMGPTALEVGQVGSFNFHVSYTPYDLSSLGSFNGWAEYSRSSAFSYQYVGVDAAAGANFVSGITVDSGYNNLQALLGRPAGVVSDFNVNLPFERDLSFSMAFANAGSFAVNAGTLFQDYVIRKPSALCLSDPACTVDIQEVLNDYHQFQGTSSNLLTVSVSAVPEPGTYALMFAGLGVVVVLGRRRRRAAHL